MDIAKANLNEVRLESNWDNYNFRGWFRYVDNPQNVLTFIVEVTIANEISIEECPASLNGHNRIDFNCPPFSGQVHLNRAGNNVAAKLLLSEGGAQVMQHTLNFDLV